MRIVAPAGVYAYNPSKTQYERLFAIQVCQYKYANQTENLLGLFEAGPSAGIV